MKRAGLSTVRFLVRLDDGEQRAWLGGLSYHEAQDLRRRVRLSDGIRLDDGMVFATGRTRVAVVACP